MLRDSDVITTAAHHWSRVSPGLTSRRLMRYDPTSSPPKVLAAMIRRSMARRIATPGVGLATRER
jgi:hypothetical protein